MRRPTFANMHGIRLAIAMVASLIGLIVGGGGLIWLSLSITLSGGYGQWQLSRQSRPNFTSSSFHALRQQQATMFSTLFEQAISTQAYHLAASSSTDRCQRGQHSFAVRDTFAYACSLQLTRYYGSDGPLRQTLLTLNGTLKRQGWTSSAGEDQVVYKYYDALYKGPGSDYTTDHLPGALYTRNGVSMEISWIERGDTDLILFENNLNPFNSSDVYKDDKPIDVSAVATNIFKDHPYGVSIALAKDYYSR